ncbi:MAG: hypothetical protein H5T97_11585, partial [Firmicutes bacterium]|nr:hypothetical protein [Bacillota bacterium]
LAAEPEEVGRRVNAMITDPARIHKTDPGHPEVCVVHTYHGIYSAPCLGELEESCRGGKIGCVACKKLLAEALNRLLDPVRERRREYLGRPGYVEEVLAAGAARARSEAAATLDAVRQALGWRRPLSEAAPSRARRAGRR